MRTTGGSSRGEKVPLALSRIEWHTSLVSTPQVAVASQSPPQNISWASVTGMSAMPVNQFLLQSIPVAQPADGPQTGDVGEYVLTMAMVIPTSGEPVPAVDLQQVGLGQPGPAPLFPAARVAMSSQRLRELHSILSIALQSVVAQADSRDSSEETSSVES